MFWGTGVLLLAIVIFVYRAIDVVLLTFAGVLFGTTLRGFGEVLAARVRIRPAWGVTVCIVALLSIIAIAMFWLVPHVNAQATDLWQQLVASFQAVRDELSGTVIGARLFQASDQVWTWLTQHISFTAGVLTGVLGWWAP